MTRDIEHRLKAPFPADRVSWRVGSTTQDKSKGMALAYIDARDVMDRLDEVVGPQNWQCDYPHANGKTVCRIGLKIGDEWVWKSDGAGDTDHEAEKGALSDAFKRAAVRWGIGRYLYDIDSPWVKIDQKGRSYVINPDELKKLQALLVKSGAGTVETGVNKEKLADDYVRLCERMLVSFGAFPSEIAQWWQDEAPNRNDFGIFKGSEHYNRLAEACRARKEHLESIGNEQLEDA